MTGARGLSVRLFLADGAPGGIVTAEIMNWTGHVLSAPRAALARALGRDEAGKTGVYFLIGEVEDSLGRRRVYVGESDEVGRRVAEHAADPAKDFFERFVLVTSKDQNLTKAHARYLENRLAAIARESRRAILDNRTDPASGALPESDVADMEFFIAQTRLIMPVLGHDFLREPAIAREASPGALELYLESPKKGLRAEAVMTDDAFVVRAGSTAAPTPRGGGRSGAAGHAALRAQLAAEGVLAPDRDGRALRFAQDFAFSSSGAAASVIHGRSANGRIAWRLKGSGATLRQHEEAQTEGRA
ncbi:GIY-YIG nuclease family protein [Oceanicella actignis]|uniref:GIY-YIG nuclease family protein n=1 Tax=Oceanicella actignis TaxID=1189325 RepID=UPI0011E6FA55|nr:GIY-YIG nuclease family protein [Oceanicella actignis]TYO91261.1 uncharacterized protein DUF4357 [Oceanicella actignis]